MTELADLDFPLELCDHNPDHGAAEYEVCTHSVNHTSRYVYLCAACVDGVDPSRIPAGITYTIQPIGGPG